MIEKTYGMSMYASKEDRDLDIMRDKAAAFDWLSNQGWCGSSAYGGELRYLFTSGETYYESKQLIDCVNQAMKAEEK
jgi:hypothetical protein